METAVDTNILYGFIGFICLMLLALVGFGYRQSRAIGEIRGDIRRLETQIDGTNARIDDLRTDLGRRIDETNARIDEVRTDLGRRIDETNARIDETRDHLERRIDETRDHLERRIENQETSIRALHREVGEVKGMQYSLYDRLDLVMRHRHHDITGAVILTPEEMAAD